MEMLVPVFLEFGNADMLMTYYTVTPRDNLLL